MILYPAASSASASSSAASASHLCQLPAFTYPLCQPPSFTHHLSHHLCQPPSFTHTHHLSHTIFVNHHLSHSIFHTPSLTTTIFHTSSFTHHLRQPPSFTHHLCQPPSHTHHLSHTIFVNHHLSHTIFVNHHLSHAIFHTPSLSTTIFHTPSFTYHHLSFAWQAWHLETSTFVWRSRRGAWSHLPAFGVAGVALVALGGALGRRWSPGAPRHFAWQAWHLVTFTFVLPGRPGTWRHLPAFGLAGVALVALGGALGHRCSPGAPRYNIWFSLLEEVALWRYPVL